MVASSDGGDPAGGSWPVPPPGPFPAPPARPASAVTDAVTAVTLVPPAVTLVLGWAVALVLYSSAGDVPGEFLGDRVVPSALLLAALAAPLALLLSWGELDLSALGMLPFAGYIYTEASGGGSVAAGLLAATAAGVAIGAAVGLARWLTRAPSAVLSLVVGFVLQAVTLKQLDAGAMRVVEDGVVDGSGLPALAAIGCVALTVTVAAAVALGRPAGDDVGTAGGPPGAAVVAGFAISGAAAGAYGALSAGMVRAVVPNGLVVLLTVLCAVAIGGVVRGNHLIGPLAAAAGAGAAQLLAVSAVLRAWELGDQQLLVASMLAACLLVAHGLDRLLRLTLTAHPPATSPLPQAPVFPPASNPPASLAPTTDGPPPPPAAHPPPDRDV